MHGLTYGVKKCSFAIQILTENHAAMPINRPYTKPTELAFTSLSVAHVLDESNRHGITITRTMTMRYHQIFA